MIGKQFPCTKGGLKKYFTFEKFEEMPFWSFFNEQKGVSISKIYAMLKAWDFILRESELTQGIQAWE